MKKKPKKMSGKVDTGPCKVRLTRNGMHVLTIDAQGPDGGKLVLQFEKQLQAAEAVTALSWLAIGLARMMKKNDLSIDLADESPPN